ncbi:MAG: hypothetical protein ACRDIU_01630 [Actinomycetota bacterium]
MPWLKVAVIAGLLLGVASPAGAQTPGAEAVKLGIKPEASPKSFFEETMTPGESRSLTAEITNFGAAAIPARTFAANAYTIINGGFGARLRGEPRTGRSLWLDYGEEVIPLAPGQTVKRPFTVAVPPETGPGEYIAALVIENDAAVQGEGAVALNRIQRQAIAVAVTVPGPHSPALEFTKAGHQLLAGRSVVAVGLKNTGNVHLRLSGTFDLKGEETDHRDVSMDTFYAGDETRLEVPLESRLRPGRYSVTLSFKDPHLNAEWTSDPLPLILEAPRRPAQPGRTDRVAPLARLDPRLLMIGGAALILVVVGLVFLPKRRRVSKRQASPSPEILD